MRDPWEEIQHPQKAKQHFLAYLRDNVFRLNFYRLHMLYFIVVILISSIIVYGEGLANGSTAVNGTRLRYIDALFLCCSAMTTTGLNTVNLGSLTSFQQAMLCVLLLIGNVVFVSTFVVVIRRHFARRKLAHVVEHSKSGRKVLLDIERHERQQLSRLKRSPSTELTPNGQGSSHEKRSSLRKRLTATSVESRMRSSGYDQRYYHENGYGWMPAPWEIASIRNAFHYPFKKLASWGVRDQSYLTFDVNLDEKGCFRALNEHERAELGGLEYRALGVLLWILAAYNLFWLALGTAFLVPYSYRSSVVNVLHSTQPGSLNPGWFGFFACSTSFANGGLNLVNANFVPFQSYYFILTVCGVLSLAGNTQFPVLLRLVIWIMSKILPSGSKSRQTLTFLLDHPRRCFLYLFPGKETWYLFAIQLMIDCTVWILFETLNLGLPAVMAIPTRVRVYDGLFQTTGLRTSGAYIVNMSYLAPALLIAYLIIMYISNFPIVMALRQTNTYGERSIGLDKGQTGRGLAMHLQTQLAYDLWFQLLAWFLICIFERGKIVAEQPGFSSFNVLFEVASAYGTVGLSTGVPYDTYSFSGAFQTTSKLVLLAVMIRGRHRGLPFAIDRSILLPGEELMHKMDTEYKEDGELHSQEEAEVHRDEELSGRKDMSGGKGAKQDPERDNNGNISGGRDGESGSKNPNQNQKEKNRVDFQLS
ncbi:hypothetical protein GJ744_000415 [Endocarpon pusillum]|uniref:Potassium transport protein n=1 Tax=Endocarpon pusillum TaxID=364733 RepID=A0A8H7E203_9EURO|nr:hypothetical protein GJ744_000415 [Endocarpon pusillum]